MQQWRGYALSRITPDFDWANQTDKSAAPTLMDRVALDSNRVAIALGDQSGLALTLGWQRHNLATQSSLQMGGIADGTPLLGALTTPFSGSTASTGLRGYFGEYAQMDLSVVLVQQRFATPYLAGNEYLATRMQPGVAALPDSSRGVGMQLGVHMALAPRLTARVGYRSRVNMDSFQNFRGIYGVPGDLDVPARLHIGLAWAATSDTRLHVGLEQVQYSDVHPFISTALPRRVLAVLGDATSPHFAWQDLNIYSLAVEQRLDAHNRFSVRYSTGQQPRPTSALLSRLLLPNVANYSWGLSFTHATDGMEWHLMANYAPSEFVLGVPTSAWHDPSEDVRQVEFESLWMWRF